MPEPTDWKDLDADLQQLQHLRGGSDYPGAGGYYNASPHQYNPYLGGHENGGAGR